MNPVFYIYTKYFIVPYQNTNESRTVYTARDLLYYYSKYRNSLAFQIKIIELLHCSLFLSR